MALLRLLDDALDQDWLMRDPFREEFFGGAKSASGADLSKPVSPLLALDIIETENQFKVMADLPGVDAGDLDLTIEKNALVMKAARNHQYDTKSDKVHRLERSYGTVNRRLILPKNADMDSAQTHFANGVLTVTIAKKAEVPPSIRKLTINAGSRE